MTMVSIPKDSVPDIRPTARFVAKSDRNIESRFVASACNRRGEVIAVALGSTAEEAGQELDRAMLAAGFPVWIPDSTP